MAAIPNPSLQPDQDAEPPTADGRETPFIDVDDETPGSDPDPEPDAEA